MRALTSSPARHFGFLSCFSSPFREPYALSFPLSRRLESRSQFLKYQFTLPPRIRLTSTSTSTSTVFTATMIGDLPLAAVEPVLSAYQPSPVDLSTLGPQLTVLFVTAAVGFYWWYLLVPSERRRLAKRKNRGDLVGLLEKLEKTDNTRESTKTEDSPSESSNRSSSPWESFVLGFQRWFYSDWLRARQERRRTRKSARLDPQEEQERAIKEPEFWSTDNPLVVTVITLTLLVAASNLFFSR